MARLLLGTSYVVEVTDRPAVGDRRYRFRAWIKGRSGGGMMVGFGATEREAVVDLKVKYRQEIAAIDSALKELDRRNGK